FLSQNPHISNRLACLVREVMELPYLKVVFVAFACLGVHLVEPFYARTIEKDATHTQLREFYKGLHTGLGQPISDNYTTFTTPEYPVVSDKLFSSVKKTYTEEVLTQCQTWLPNTWMNEEADRSHATPSEDCPGQAEEGLWDR
ncbi:Hypothetical protein FKW44_010212, partial [Caligus rogercresseyi]